MSNQSRFGCLSVLLFFVLCLSLLVNLFFLARGGSRGVASLNKTVPKFEEETLVAPRSGEEGADDKIAQIYLRGIITSAEPGSLGETMVDDLKLQLKQALADAKVKSIVLYVDSPGGEVTASDIIYQAVKAARAQKPIVVYMGSLAASGGYYVSCAGNHIIANETTFTGSIGVIMQSLHYKTLLDKVGLEVLTFKSGKFKDMLSGSRDLTDEEKAYTQSLIDQTYGKFVGIVARERKLDEAVLRAGIADGRVVSGLDAVKEKLIDGTGSVEDAYEKAMELGHAKGAAVIKYESGMKLGKLLKLLGKSDSAGSKVELNLTSGLLPKLEAGRLYYLPAFLVP
jgi:protease-4